MKLKYFFIALISCAALFAACEKEEPASLDNISLDRTYVSIPAGGGDANLVVTARDPWSFAKVVVIGKDDNKNDVFYSHQLLIFPKTIQRYIFYLIIPPK